MQYVLGQDSTSLPMELIQAYLETEYRAEGLLQALCIGEKNRDLAALYKAAFCTSAVYVTACNPWSKRLEATQNNERQNQLSENLAKQGYSFWAGEGAHPHGNWTPEPSYLVAGITYDEARALGQELEQNAVVWCDEEVVPWLVLLR